MRSSRSNDYNGNSKQAPIEGDGDIVDRVRYGTNGTLTFLDEARKTTDSCIRAVTDWD